MRFCYSGPVKGPAQMLVSDIESPIEKGYEALMHGKQAKVATYFHFALHSYKVYRDLKHMDMVRTPRARMNSGIPR